MNDIAEHTPKQSKTVAAIYAHYKKVGDDGHMSRTLPVSLIGHPCERYLWYVFRQCCKPEFSGRMYRLFETGQLEEDRFTKDLRDIGCTVHDVDENRRTERTQQFKVTALGEHLKGYLDSVILGVPEAPKTWHVGEYKTHSAKSFRELVKKSVKESKPQHYAQMQIYMHLTGMRRALYLACNKDTDELYSERVRYDKAEAEQLMERAERIITHTQPPERLGARPDYYICNWCDANAICWGSNEVALPVPSLSCRQCCHATPVLDGEDAQWKCETKEAPLTILAMKVNNCKPCVDLLILPGLIAFAEPIDYSNDSIKFVNEDGKEWEHGNGTEAFSSEELRILAPCDLVNPLLWGVKGLFGAVAIACGEDILDRYPKGDSRIIWEGQLTELIAAWKQHYKEELTELTSITRCNFPDHSAAEYSGGRLAIAYPETKSAEIREGVK